MKIDRRPLTPEERSALAARLRPHETGWLEGCCAYFVLPVGSMGCAFLLGMTCIGLPLSKIVGEEFSTSPFHYAGVGPGYGLAILALLVVIGFWIHFHLKTKRLHRRIRIDLAEGQAAVVRAQVSAAVICMPEPNEVTEEDDELDDDYTRLTAFLHVSPKEVLVVDRSPVERREQGFPRSSIEVVWGPHSQVRIDLANTGPPVVDVLETSLLDEEGEDESRFGVSKYTDGQLLEFAAEAKSLPALLEGEPAEKRSLWTSSAEAPPRNLPRPRLWR